jgi:serine/threonine protein kinase
MASVRSQQAYFLFVEGDDASRGGPDATARLRGPGLVKAAGASTEPARPAPPDRMGQYLLERRLGQGGMAEVFAATHVGAAGFSRSVCLKRILPHLATDPEFRELFIREARVAGSLCHSNLVQVFDCIEDGETLAIVMELVDGIDLKRLCRALLGCGQRVPPRAVAHIAGQLLAGLRYAHDRGVVHRDVSPHNVLVSREGEVKLADFGVAKAVMTRASRTGTLKGKLAYMSPEQAGARPVDQRSDLYSTGLVLYELLLGRRYFPPLGHSELIALVSHARPPRLDHVEPSLRALVGGLLEPRPAARFQSARDALAALPASDAVGPAGAAALAALVRGLDRAPDADPAPSPWSLPRREPGAPASRAAELADLTERVADAPTFLRDDRREPANVCADATATRDSGVRLSVAVGPTLDQEVLEIESVVLGPGASAEVAADPSASAVATETGRLARGRARLAAARRRARRVAAALDRVVARPTARLIAAVAFAILLAGVTLGAGGRLLVHLLVPAPVEAPAALPAARD